MTEDAGHHLSEAQLHEAAEGTLASADRTTVDRHLAACEECRADVERLRSLLTITAALPREIEPPMDLWPGIGDRVKARQPARRPQQWPPRGDHRVWLAAAAVLLIAMSSAVTMLLVRDGRLASPRSAPAIATGGGTSPAPASGTPVSDPYDRMDRELAARFAEQREMLQPETIEKVERNLRIIDEAIGEIRQAMADDPHNEALQQLLKASYSQKQALLHQVSQS